MASESPWRDSALARQSVAMGALNGYCKQVEVGRFGVSLPVQSATECLDAPGFAEVIKGVLGQGRPHVLERR